MRFGVSGKLFPMQPDPRLASTLPGDADEGLAVCFEDHDDYDEDLFYELSRDK